MLLSQGIRSCLPILPLLLFTEAHESNYVDDICGYINKQRIYLEQGEKGSLVANYANNILKNRITNSTVQKKCTVEFVTCPFCVLKIIFKSLNISRSCDRSTVFDTCGCDYVWIYDPASEQQSGEQFCGRFIKDSVSQLDYVSKTRKVAIAFLYNDQYEHAFTLDYFTARNKFTHRGHPKFGNENNSTQTISSPYFPSLYPSDLYMEHEIVCESNETCRISLVFTDFLISSSSIIEFFDWNGERLYVTRGSIFRPPVIITSGPSLSLRFYANGATNFGFKASYAFILGRANELQLKPDIDCGGHVNNLGGGITMMSMIENGTKSYDCIWLIKPPNNYYHMKTHLYAKVANFDKFAGSTELTIRHGLTSDGPIVEHLKYSLARAVPSLISDKEHVVPIEQGFYVSLKGIFGLESRLSIVYAAFNYKNCLSGSDFLCLNQRCISMLLNCDGFDHCGDESDEFADNCAKDPKDRRKWSHTPNFLFPKGEGLVDLSLSTVVFLLASFGVTALAFSAMVLLYRIKMKKRDHRRHLQNHMETIHAILEEGGVIEVEEELITPDDPPDYEAPPEYRDIVRKMKEKSTKRCGCKYLSTGSSTRVVIPNSPPPVYKSNNSVAEVVPKPYGTDFGRFGVLRSKDGTNFDAVSSYSDSELHYSFREAERNGTGEVVVMFRFVKSFSSHDLYSL